jgi:hypothetical protein
VINKTPESLANLSDVFENMAVIAESAKIELKTMRIILNIFQRV